MVPSGAWKVLPVVFSDTFAIVTSRPDISGPQVQAAAIIQTRRSTVSLILLSPAADGVKWRQEGAVTERDASHCQFPRECGQHEAWIGEHHSAGWELISSPGLFIAIAAERTKSIKFGTGVISLPYHNPLMVANRIIQLDHHTRGRVMFGAGPGLLASDALMMGIDPDTQRDRMAEALDLIPRLFKGETVTEKTDWYNFVGARAHILPYTKPYLEIAVVSSVTPSGGQLAGKCDLAMICVAATNPFGFDALGANWKIANDIAAENGRQMDPARLRPRGANAYSRDPRQSDGKREIRVRAVS
jgi:limonene 1,2-monooxygenase